MSDTFNQLETDDNTLTQNELKSESESISEHVVNSQYSIDTKVLEPSLVMTPNRTHELLLFKDPSSVKAVISSFLVEDEQVYFYLSATTEEIAITNFGLIYTSKALSSTDKVTIRRAEYRHNQITNLRIDSAVELERDAELKFDFGDDSISWSINNTDTYKLFTLYKRLNKVSSIQKELIATAASIEQSLTIASNSVQHSNTTDLEYSFKNIYHFAKQEIETTNKIDFTEAF